MINHTKEYQEKYGFDSRENDKAFSTHNNEADAFKHTFMQAWLTANLHEKVAKKLGDMHESDGKGRNQPTGEENMDLWNNNQGREIGLEVQNLMQKYNVKNFTPETNDLIAEKVMQRMKAGKLITNPDDSRRYVPKNRNGNSTTGQAAPVSNTAKSNPVNAPSIKSEPAKTTSQKISDAIRAQYNSKMEKNNQLLKKIFGSHSPQTGSGRGHWVTINGTHVFIGE